MLSLFRHAPRRSLFAARPAFVAHYSAESSPDVDTAPMEEVREVLEEQSEKEKDSGSSEASDSSVKVPERWKAFKDGCTVRPYDFTHKARFNAPRTYNTRKPQVGPPFSVASYDDVFYQNDVDPLDFSMDPNVLSAFVSDMGKIYGRNITGLTSKSQRRMGKAIRRAKMMGIIPILYRSPFYFNANAKSRKTGPGGPGGPVHDRN